MGKDHLRNMDSGKLQRCLHPVEAQKRAQKKRLVQQKEEVKRRKKFEDQVAADSEAVRRRVSAMEKKDKLGMLSHRQRNEKNEMKELLAQHEKDKKAGGKGPTSEEILAGLPDKREYEVTMINAYGSKMAVGARAPAAGGSAGIEQAPAADAGDLGKDVVIPYDAPQMPAPMGLPGLGGEAEAEATPPAAAVAAAAQAKRAQEEEEAAPPVEVQWNQSAMLSMVPSSVLKRKRQQAQQGRAASRNVIPGSSVTAADLAATMAPKGLGDAIGGSSAPAAPAPAAAPAPRPVAAGAPRATFKTINLVPDVEDDDDDDEDSDDAAAAAPTYTYTPATNTSSLFFTGPGAAAVPAAAAAPAPTPQPPAAPTAPAPAPTAAPASAATTDIDDEYAKFLAGL